LVVDVRDVITCFKFGDDRLRGLASAEGQILPFPIDFDGRPYNTLTLPCERVITVAVLLIPFTILLSHIEVENRDFRLLCSDYRP